MLAVADYTPRATLTILFGRDIDVMTKSHGDICINAPSQVGTYIP